MKMQRTKVAISGANGFVGSALVEHLAAVSGFEILAMSRHPSIHYQPNVQHIRIGNLADSDDDDMQSVLTGVDVLVHTAARVHVMKDTVADPLAEFRRVNVDGTLNLARQAAAAGVRRFVFVSSIKVNGESTLPGKPFRADDTPAPEDAYGISKKEAEDGLQAFATQSGMEVVIVRPPLVYGPGVKANFASMIRWLARGVPLPLGGVHENRRSLVALDNLLDFLRTCVQHPDARNQIFMVSDGEDLSTAELLRRIGLAMRKPARLFYIAPAFLKFGAALVGKAGVAQRLCGSLQVDISKNQRLLGWTPPISVDEGMRHAVSDYLKK